MQEETKVDAKTNKVVREKQITNQIINVACESDTVKQNILGIADNESLEKLKEKAILIIKEGEVIRLFFNSGLNKFYHGQIKNNKLNLRSENKSKVFVDKKVIWPGEVIKNIL